MSSLLSNYSRLFVSSPRLLATSSATDRNVKHHGKPSGNPHETFYHSDLLVEQASPEEMKPKPAKGAVLKFGHLYSDHMLAADWDDKNGWTVPQITPVRNLSIHPGAKALHYASQLFEGMKAYRGIDNKIRMFRPDMNMARMKRTAKRAALPDFDAEEAIRCMADVIRLDQEWVPRSTTSSLYIRPTLIGTDPTLGVGNAHAAKFYVLTGPVGQYYETGFQPVSLLADSRYCRAFPGGVGSFKMGCNYAPTIWVGKEAEKRDCQQVLWLYGDNEEITEVGAMNIFIYWKNEQGENELITPPLSSGLILPGVTRDSLLELAREWNEFKVTERALTMPEIDKALKEKRLFEMFGAGTACVVSPVGKLVYHNKATDVYEEWKIPTMKNNPNLMQRFYETIVDIQYGRTTFRNWMREI